MRQSIAWIAVFSALAAPATAQTIISDERATPVDTATAANGAPDDLTISADGSVRIDNGDGAGPAAVTVNSSNTFTNEGLVEIIQADGAVAVLAQSGLTGGVANTGCIAVNGTTDSSCSVATSAGEDIRTGATGILIQDGFVGPVDNSGSILINNTDNAAGVRVAGVYEGTLTHSGAIRILEDYTATDTDDDGDADTSLASGSGRTGILIEGGVTGGVSLTEESRIVIEGNDSAGLRITGPVSGDVVVDQNQTAGATTVSVIGDRSVGVDIQGDVGGGVDVGDVFARGENARGVVVSGDVGGAFIVDGAVDATGYRFSGSNFNQSNLDTDDLQQGGAAVTVAGDVAGGVLINGATGNEGEDDETPSTGAARSQGAAPGLLIEGGANGATIGAVADGDGYGVVNRGVISGGGLFNPLVERDADGNAIFDENDLATEIQDFDAAALQITGSDGGGVNVAGGLSNRGTITATAVAADTTAIQIGAGATVPSIRNEDTGNITALTTALNGLPGGDSVAQAIVIDAGATVNEILNDGSITAVGTTLDPTGRVAAITDASASATSIQNTGALGATASANTAVNENATAEDITRIAYDGAGRNADTVFLQLRRATEVIETAADAEAGTEASIEYNAARTPLTEGELRFGSGDDTLEVRAGQVSGDISFGAGQDQLIIDAASVLADETEQFFDDDGNSRAGQTITDTAIVTGGIQDSDGQLVIDVRSGTLQIASADAVNITDLTVGSDGVLQVTVDAIDADAVRATLLTASGSATFADGAELGANIDGLLIDPFSATIIDASSLTVDGVLDPSVADDTPFLYDITLTTTADNDVVINLRRLTAEEIGFDVNQAAAYEPLIAAISGDETIATALSATTSSDDFTALFDQLLPDYSDAALQFAIAFNDGTVGAIGNRLNAVRAGQDSAGSLWVQEVVTYLDRSSEIGAPGYRGYGFGLAAGLDRPLGPFYAVGLSATAATGQYESPTGFDDPLSVSFLSLGSYAAAARGPFLLDLHASAGATEYDQERLIDLSDGTTPIRVAANWRGTHVAAGARTALDLQAGRLYARPGLSFDYVRLDEDGYTETGGGAANITREDRLSEVGSLTAMLNVGARFENARRGSWWSPKARIGYRSVLFHELGLTNAQVLNPDTGEVFAFTLDTILPEDAVIGGFGIEAGSDFSSFALDYDFERYEEMTRHTGRATFRFLF